MPAASSIKLTGSITSLKAGSRVVNLVIGSNADSPSQVTQLELASGDNTITIPTNADGVIITFDSTSTATKKLKGAAGDTGVTLSKVSPSVITFDATPPANFIINSSSADTGKVTEITFF